MRNCFFSTEIVFFSLQSRLQEAQAYALEQSGRDALTQEEQDNIFTAVMDPAQRSRRFGFGNLTVINPFTYVQKISVQIYNVIIFYMLRQPFCYYFYLQARQARQAQKDRDKEEIKELRAMVEQLREENRLRAIQVEQLDQKLAQYLQNHGTLPSSSGASGGDEDP